MKETNDKYLIITQSDIIDAKCSECSKADINIYAYPNLSYCIKKLAKISQIADIKVIGVFKKVDKFIIDKDFNVIEEQQ